MDEENKFQDQKRPKSGVSNKVHPFAVDDGGKLESGQGEPGAPVEKRDNWGGKLDFFFSALSFSVGLGAVWRFPYLCFKNGGGAFLIPFLIFLFLFGIPLVYMEFGVGQFASRGPIMSWVMVPLFKGVGITMNLINNYVNLYYIMIIAYSLYYLFLSFRYITGLPWEKCNPDWASPNCVDNFTIPLNYTTCEEPGQIQCPNGQCYSNVTLNGLEANCIDTENLVSLGHFNAIFPSEDYWYKVVLNISGNLNELDGIEWPLVLTLFISWIICFLCLFRGVTLSGKITYFTALFPYLVLLILGIRGVMLDGAGTGIEFYITPKVEKLADVGVWKDAAVQVFFTLSLSYGGMVALSSYNKFNHNILRDAFLLSITNFLTCILAGFVVFVYMGALSKSTGIPVDKVVQDGQGLVYIVYPYAATTLGAAPLWAIMFFVMMIALGMGTMMASVETLTTSLEDFFPVLKKTALIKAGTLAIICTIYFTVGLIFTTRAGTYWIEFFDTYSANFGIILIAMTESVSVGWIYGYKLFKADLSAMLDPENKLLNVWFHRMFYYWRISWQFIIPIILLTLCIFSWIDSGPIETGDITFPVWSDVLGNLLSASTLSGMIGWAIYEIYQVAVKKKNTWKSLVSRSESWRPLHQEDFDKVLNVYKQHPELDRTKYEKFIKNSSKNTTVEEVF